MTIIKNIVRAVNQFDYEIRTRLIQSGKVLMDVTDLVNCSQTKLRQTDLPCSINGELCTNEQASQAFNEATMSQAA